MRFLTGVLIGAVVGGALTLLQKDTRSSVKTGMSNSVAVFQESVQHPQQMYDKVAHKVQQWKQSAAIIQRDVASISEQVKELQQLTPQVVTAVTETVGAVQHAVSNGQKREIE